MVDQSTAIGDGVFAFGNDEGDEAGKTEKNISFFLILMAFHFHSIFCANKMDNAKFIKYVHS